MAMFQQVKCPHCGHEFKFNLNRATEEQRTVTMRFMGTARKIGPRPKHITASCPNPHCRRSFYVK